MSHNQQQTQVIGFAHNAQQGEEFARACGFSYITIAVHHFPDGESKVQLPEVIAEQVILFCSLDQPNNKLIELILAASGARAMGAKHISLVCPYLCYMRQDKAFYKGEVISQQVIGQLLAYYFDKVLTVDAHLHRIHKLSEAIPAAQAINITATDSMAHFIMEQQIDRPYLIGPDKESEQWVAAIAMHYQMDYGIAVKERYGDRDVKIYLPDAVYQGRNIILVDDVASTGKTLIGAAQALSRYKPASISVLVTHALFVEDSINQLNRLGVTNIWSCDSISHSSNAVKLAAALAAHF